MYTRYSIVQAGLQKGLTTMRMTMTMLMNILFVPLKSFEKNISFLSGSERKEWTEAQNLGNQEFEI